MTSKKNPFKWLGNLGYISLFLVILGITLLVFKVISFFELFLLSSILICILVIINASINSINIQKNDIGRIGSFFVQDTFSAVLCWLIGYISLSYVRIPPPSPSTSFSDLSNFLIGIVGISVSLGGIVVSCTNFTLDSFKVITGVFNNQKRLGFLGSTFVGILERLFFGIATAFKMPGLIGAMVAWIGLKGVNIWLKTYDDKDHNNSAIRLKHAAMINLVSFLFALFGGLYYHLHATGSSNIMKKIFYPYIQQLYGL